MSDPEVHEMLGNLSARMGGMEARAEKMEEKLDSIHDNLQQVVGGFRALKLFGTGAAAVMGFLGAFVHKFYSWVTTP